MMAAAKKTTQEKSSNKARGATATVINWRALLRAWLQHHQDSIRESVLRQKQSVLQHLLTATVIGITLALPALFILAINNAQQLSEHWDGAPRLSIFLQRQTADSDIAAIQQQLQQHPTVTKVEWITPEQGLKNFEQETHLDNTLTLLDENPLPPLLAVHLQRNATIDDVQQLQIQWQKLPHVDSVQTDFAWVKKLFHLIQLGNRIALGLSVLLGAGALLSIGNTVRLAIENRHTEISVVKLMGATDAFVRRPFLYTGFWFGLYGGIVAVILVLTGFYSIVEPAAALIALYHSTFTLQSPSVWSMCQLLLVGIALGVFGAWVTVGYHLHSLRPR
jgi:cell division transport system permease protein